MATFNEVVFEESALGWLANLGWQVIRGGTSGLNPLLPEAWENALTKLALPSGSNIVARNREFHRMLGNGVTAEYPAKDGALRGAQAREHRLCPYHR